MKKTLLLKTMLLLCAIVFGTSSSWADKVTLQYTNTSTTTNMTGGNDAATLGLSATDWSVVGDKGGSAYYPGLNKSKYIALYYNADGCNTLTITALKANTTINSIEITYTAATYNNGKVYVGGSEVTSSSGTYTINNSSCVITNGNTSNVQVRISKIDITYSTASAYTITPQSNNESYGTVSLSGSVITATPAAGYTYADPAYTVNPANSATVSQSGDEFTVTPSANTTVTINFEAIPTYTVTLGDDQSTLTETTGGAGVILPTRGTLNGYAFAGWSETNVITETTVAPTIIPAGAYAPANDITLYPIYTKTGGGSAPSAFSVGDTGNYAIVSAEQNGKYYALPTTPTVNNGKITAQEITVSEMGDVKYVTPTDASGFTWTIATATNGYTLSDGSNYIYHSNGGSSGTNLSYGTSTSYTWAFTADGDYVTMAGMSGTTTNGRGMLFSGTTIGGYSLSNATSSGYYKVMILPISVGSTTYYWSSPVAAAVETPSIVVADNPFLFSTTATITCATEGATIKYSYDGDNWNDYFDALTITETKTIYAKAVKGEDVSSVAQVTATKNLAEATVTVSGDLTLDLDGGTDVNAGTLTAAVTYNDAAVAGATVTWSGNNDAVATIDASTGAVTIKTTGEVTFTATYAGNSDYAEATGTKTVTVTDSKGPGSENNPYTVAQARAAIDAGTGVTDVYVTGIVCVGGSNLTNNGEMNYWISDDGTETDKFEIYKGKGISGASFSSVDDVQVGDVVVVSGNLTKYGSTYEFAAGSQLVSLNRPAIPTIVVTPTSLTDFTYEVGNGPSIAKTFTVEGSNLTENITLSLGESSYEMSLSENSDYTDELSLAPTTGAVAETTVYVRLKAGLDVKTSYEGTITLTSTDAIDKSVSLEGSVTAPEDPNYTWNLSTNSYSAASEDQVTWSGDYATMVVDKAESTTAANNYLGGDSNNRTSTRFYKNSILTITPANGYSITSVEFTATSDNYASALNNSTWSNASAAVSNTTVTVTPTDGSQAISATIGGACGFTAVKVYYVAPATATIPAGKEWITFCSTANLDFSEAIEGLKGAYTITAHESQAIALTATEMTGKVAAGTGLLLRAAEKKDVDQVITIPVAETGDEQTGNMLKGVTEDTPIQPSEGEYTNLGLSNGEFHPYGSEGILAAGKAYLQILTAQMPTGGNNAKLIIVFDGETTGIDNLNLNDNDNIDVNAPMYNLAGQRVNKSYKGVVIVNGKKVVRK